MRPLKIKYPNLISLVENRGEFIKKSGLLYCKTGHTDVSVVYPFSIELTGMFVLPQMFMITILLRTVKI